MTTPFISWLGHGAANLAPPGVFTDAKATMFAVDANRKAMQALADALLNPAGANTVRYEALLPIAMLSFMDIAKCTSSTDVVGWLPGRECAIWVPLLETRNGLPTRLVFWAPYIFIDYTLGLVIGRETWGWPKVLADIGVASDTPGEPRYRCATTYFPTMSADTQGVTGVLFQVLGDTAHETPPVPQWRTGAEASAALAGALLGGAAPHLIEALGSQPRVPSVALKQFRDAGAPETACYQAICDSPITLTAFKGGGLLPGEFVAEITTCGSHRIVEDLLGRPPDAGTTRLPVKFAAWSTVDFIALDGGNIVVGT